MTFQRCDIAVVPRLGTFVFPRQLGRRGTYLRNESNVGTFNFVDHIPDELLVQRSRRKQSEADSLPWGPSRRTTQGGVQFASRTKYKPPEVHLRMSPSDRKSSFRNGKSVPQKGE